MFEDFLREYIQDLIECSSDKYDITEENINDVACIINNNEHLWNIIDNAIYEEIDKYIIESEEE